MMKNIMRTLAALLSLMMALCAFPAYAASGDITIFRQAQDQVTDSMRAMVYYNSTLYVFSYGDNYYTWTRGSGELVAHPFDQSFTKTEDGGYVDYRIVSAGPDGIYAILIANEPSEEEPEDARMGVSTTFDKTTLCKLNIADDGTITFDEGVELDWDDMVQEYDEYEYSREVRYPFISGNSLAFSTYGDTGTNNTIFTYDIESGDYEILELEVEDTALSVEGMCKYTDGKALVASYTYSSEEEPVRVYSVDLATGEATEMLSLPTKNYIMPSNLLYDAASDTLYYTANGELFKVPGLDMDAVQSVAAVQIDSWSEMAPQLTEDGYFICSDYQTIIARNTDPTARAATSMTVYTNYNQPMQDAYYTFANTHTDVDVVLATSYEDITEAMMNQSDAVDIYTVSVTSEDYAALFDRGYLADLSSSTVLTDIVSEMYPNIQSVVMKDGALVALPVEMYSNCMSYNPTAMEKLGLTADDVPKTWIEYLQFLQNAPELIGDTGVTVFETYMTQADARANLFYSMLNSYMLYLMKADGAEMSFDTDIMRGMLTEYEKIDWSAFGLMESYDEEDMVYAKRAMAVDGPGNSALFMSYGSVSVDSYMYQAQTAVPMLLKMADGAEPMIAGDMTVAIVNPYSKNQDLAIAYLENVVNKFRGTFLANVCPDRNDPIRNAYYEENLAYYEEQIASIEAELEKADEDDKADWQAKLDEFRGYYEDFQKTGAWDASEESIANYRNYAPFIQINEYFGLDNENSGEFYDNIQQYLDGTIDGNTMLTNIDKKLKMMLQEGL